MEKFPAGKFHAVPLRNAATLHSALMSAVRITLPHLSASSAMNVPNAADVIDIGSTPKPASRALMRGSAVTALISWLSLSITSAGVAFGAPIPYHWLAGSPGRNSAGVGISGSTPERVSVVPASARSMPPLMYWMHEDMVPKTTCTCPLSRSGTKPPRYGTWTRLTPVIILNRSPKIWDTDPLPDDPMLILLGLALA